jgi:hypothetical protein
MRKLKSTEESINIHGNNYDYSDVEYKNSSEHIKINCRSCNEIFYQSPYHHLEGSGCYRCCLLGYSKKQCNNFINTQ